MSTTTTHYKETKMQRPERKDYNTDVEFQLAYMQWRREQLALRQESDND